MRTFSLIAVVASMAIAAPALAQSMTAYSANDGTAMNGHRSHMMMHNATRPRQHALGSVRHPTVGNTANQRVNGG